MKNFYSKNLALLTDLYQLTMAYGYWKAGKAEDEAVFHLFFRNLPFEGGYAIACGLEYAIDYLENYQFENDDLDYLASLSGNDGKALFESEFLEYLRNSHFTCDIDAVPEGTTVFPNEPILRVKGPIIQCQLLETPLLNIINFQTLIATKAARICQAADDDPVLEFGLRRAQGYDGAIAATRAAYVGGVAATSNVLGGQIHDIPVKGTHAHSWVMSFDSELEAFETYAKVMPNNCVFLVDTYDTEKGVENAVLIGKQLRSKGHEMLGIRLDSGDLVDLSIKARKILDENGFPDSKIVASNDLDEYAIANLKSNGAKIDIWGVGTRLITAHEQPALGGVYKIGALKENNQEWRYTLKLSEDPIKISNPGIQQIRRFSVDNKIWADAIFDEKLGIDSESELFVNAEGSLKPPVDVAFEDLLKPIFRAGKNVYTIPKLKESRARTLNQLKHLPMELKANKTQEKYPVALEKQLFELKQKLINERS